MIRPPPRVPRVQRPAVSRFYKKPANGARVSLHQTSAGYGLLLSRLGCDPSFQLPSDTRSSALFGLLISCVLIKPLKGFTRVGRDQTSSRPFSPRITPHPYNPPSIPPYPYFGSFPLPRLLQLPIMFKSSSASQPLGPFPTLVTTPSLFPSTPSGPSFPVGRSLPLPRLLLLPIMFK